MLKPSKMPLSVKSYEPLEYDTNTERWTSAGYQIQFSQVGYIEPLKYEEDHHFMVSAWGVSDRLMKMISDYRTEDINYAAQWLTRQQNGIVGDMLGQLLFPMGIDSMVMPSMDNFFMSIDSELYLPRGFRMPINCVTNIVPHGDFLTGLDKFVAFLDPSEVKTYIHERKGISWNPKRVH